ncbi:hypothetical protein Syun_012202 [Stephania yunnanensis]|uniref:Uncharacterized protein n=1 Tax=Stephania yunnanensis TaxID=152371 RepID=A0AAP0K1G8_9MAGN
MISLGAMFWNTTGILESVWSIIHESNFQFRLLFYVLVVVSFNLYCQGHYLFIKES